MALAYKTKTTTSNAIQQTLKYLIAQGYQLTGSNVHASPLKKETASALIERYCNLLVEIEDHMKENTTDSSDCQAIWDEYLAIDNKLNSWVEWTFSCNLDYGFLTSLLKKSGIDINLMQYLKPLSDYDGKSNYPHFVYCDIDEQMLAIDQERDRRRKEPRKFHGFD